MARNAAYGLSHRFANGQYGMVPGYRDRQPSYFDDTGNADDWQREVYVFAARVMQERKLRRVYDVGCGSGFKLVHYLGEYESVGFDLEPTVRFLKEKYPDRIWAVATSSDRNYPPPDLLICSDVIEHVHNPDELIRFINDLQPRFVLLSTPDRDLLYPPWCKHRFGPPLNPTHVREWNFREFAAYASQSFRILEHRISNREQGTQLMFGTPK